MKNKIANYIFLLLLAYCAYSCTPENAEIHDISKIELSSIDSIVIAPNYKKIIADGKAELDLRPVLYGKNKQTPYKIPEDRIKAEWLKYETVDGKQISRYFTTADTAMIGKTIKVILSLKGTTMSSDTVSFEILAPLEEEYRKAIQFPIVFHIIQTKEELDTYGVKYTDEKIALTLKKINDVFAGKASKSPISTNTYISFKPAIYNPKGQKLETAGINRIITTNITTGEDGTYADLLSNTESLWDPQKYVNIWLLSDFHDKEPAFGIRFSNQSTPHYVYSTANPMEAPMPIAFLGLKTYQDEAWKIKESGIIYKLQSLNQSQKKIKTSMSTPIDNELIHYLGRYFGLFPTLGSDFCADTHDYSYSNEYYKNNETSYKEANNCFFLSENIMDDAAGMHTFISKDQAQRIRWILNNCPERSSWQSSFAFKGQ